jgi:peptide/nickel transport system permease protein
MATATPTPTPTPAPAAAPERRRTWRTLPVVLQLRQSVGLQRGMLVAGLVLTGIFLFTAIFAPLLAPYEFNQLRDANGPFGAQAHPSANHLLGTTVGGYDVLSRVIWGTRTALAVIVVAVLLSFFAGVLLGLVSGYFGGWLDRVLVVVCDAVYAFPALLLAIVVAIVISGGQSSLLGGILAAAISITVVYIPQYFRVIRNSVISVREEPYVEAARVLGAFPRTVIRRYVFGNVVQNVPVIATLNAADALLTLAGLGFLGYGVQPTEGAEWGYDLQRALGEASSGVWWTSVYPGLAIVLLVTGLTLVGESLNDLLNPVLRRRQLLPVKITNVELELANADAAAEERA